MTLGRISKQIEQRKLFSILVVPNVDHRQRGYCRSCPNVVAKIQLVH